MDEIQARLARCFSAVLPVLTPDEILRGEPGDLKEWDSITTVTLIAVVEEEFGIEIDLEEIDGIASFGRVLSLVTAVMQMRASG